jgi:cell division GTPase FtsZ
MTTSFDLGSLVKLQVNAVAEFIYDLVDPSANLIFGAVIDQSLTGQVSLEELEISRVFLYGDP